MYDGNATVKIGGDDVALGYGVDNRPKVATHVRRNRATLKREAYYSVIYGSII